MTPEQYRANQQATASNSQAKVLTLFGLSALVGGLVSAAEFKQLAATVVAAANIQAAMLADLFMTRRLNTKPLGLGRPLDEANRIADAIQTIITDTETQPLDKIVTDTETPLPKRISRLAHAEPLSAGQSASREVLIRNEIKEYVFDNDEDSCNLCTYLGSQPWPVATKAAITHPGCGCILLESPSSKQESE